MEFVLGLQAFWNQEHLFVLFVESLAQWVLAYD